MALSDIAAGLEVTATQRERGPTTVDGTERALTERLREFADGLPCDASTAALLLDTYYDGGSVETAALAAGVAPVAGAKTLHLLGVDGLTPLSPLAREIVADWLAGELTRSDALALTGASEHEFALGAFVEAHDPLPGARAVVDGEFLR
ncbi:hypothetical protein [Salarchaeum sp. JOR-1]|uniref:DUF7858 family protein n=1 Tax=Salarchaeum sp. JOR-1 TaxID=2599399 RepID=UPI0011985DA2|nr:hypothetical protein [Salarchaeum sp. JOR-1]QDX40338.1 hypothetical protein FQU85_05285 [Salarchaeum sp. JOR-1]